MRVERSTLHPAAFDAKMKRSTSHQHSWTVNTEQGRCHRATREEGAITVFPSSSQGSSRTTYDVCAATSATVLFVSMLCWCISMSQYLVHDRLETCYRGRHVSLDDVAYLTPYALVFRLWCVNNQLRYRYNNLPTCHIYMLCSLVFLATGAIASYASDISIDGNTIFADNVAGLDTFDGYGGETERTPRVTPLASTSAICSKANHSRAVTLHVADHSA